MITKTKEDRTCASGRINSSDCCTYISIKLNIALIRDKKREGEDIKRGKERQIMGRRVPARCHETRRAKEFQLSRRFHCSATKLVIQILEMNQI